MLVPGASLVSEYIPINRSRLIFLRMKTHISFVEEIKLPSLIGSDILEDLAANRGDEADVKYIKLLALLHPVIINFAAARLIKASGSLTDRGLYYTSIVFQFKHCTIISRLSDKKILLIISCLMRRI